jgi:caffeoyl-CoA O-methyltransferase
MPPKYQVLDDALYGYVARHHTHHGDPLIEELRRETVASTGGRHGMQVAEEQATLLGILAAACGARRPVEVGTFTGLSALAVARALPPGGRLTCCDVSAEWTAIARRYWERAGVADRIDLRVGPAADTLRTFPEGDTFDFAFIDADKPSYDSYYELLLPRLRRGSLILIDNALQHGRVVDPQDDNARALVALNAKITADRRVESAIVTVSDGVLVCRKR